MKLPLLAFEVSRTIDPDQTLVLACSGGLDSVVLLDLFAKVRERKRLLISVAHIHHGPDEKSGFDSAMSRDRAARFVEQLAQRYAIPFHLKKGSEPLRSEAELRDFRHQALTEIRMKTGATKVVLAHHADDLLETRLMRLIRGTGPFGLRAMRESTKTALRPLLRFSRAQLEAYAREQTLEFIEDPSNRDERYFRNWLRHAWLPALEAKQSGSMKALARSLDLLAEVAPAHDAVKTRIARADFQALGEREKRATLATMARGLGARDFGLSRISEVLKRLGRLEMSRQKNARFEVGRVTWVVTPHEIEAL